MKRNLPDASRAAAFPLTAAIAIALTVTTASSSSPANGLAPIYTAAEWINGAVPTNSLRGKVVIVDIFTFDCLNCKHVVPNLRRLYASEPHDRFAIVGVHSPETDYERQRGNVLTNLRLQGITWPVRIDNDMRIWSAYGTQYWPTQLIFDGTGRLRKTVVGEGQDADINATVRALLDELTLRLERSSDMATPEATPRTRTYTLLIGGLPGQRVNLKASGLPPAWVATFCTERVCAPFHVSVMLPAAGRLATTFRVIPAENAGKTATVKIDAATGLQSRSLSFRVRG